MNNRPNTTYYGEVLERITRDSSRGASEIAVVTSPGARATAWAVKVKSHFSYNVYNVVAVVLSDAGNKPTEIGQEQKAVNLAEPFQQQGTLQAGTYAIMFRVGGKNVFHAPV